MAGGFVQPRPFVKERNKRSSFSPNKFTKLRTNKLGKSDFVAFLLQNYLGWIAVSILLILLGLFVLKGTWYNPNHLIQNINYGTQTRTQYENTELFVLASSYLRGKFWNSLQINGKNELLSLLQKEYPFVRDVHLNYQGAQTLEVEMDFYEPTFLVKLGEKKFGVRTGGIGEELLPDRTLSQSGFIIDTPAYLSGTVSLSGFFYQVPYERYQINLPKILETFPNMLRFVYLAGSPNFVIFEENRTTYLHRDHIDLQLKKYQRLQKYFSNFAGVFEIDLGSFTDNKIIIKE